MECKADDCKRPVEDKYDYCSMECAMYAGVFSVKDGAVAKSGIAPG